ncbi:Tetrahydrobiopterin biosynthesis enzymes-like protein [Glarea lozoyensis ATCC 20868]|uniref:dihydroneopterin aldolase n=1 Tax=Glarea lozoyensis (strain ATCC 20868 / MF5171) TaxID=1116229 RepID=S3CNE8_GLAL2|nr:Tetrahydrobiopterin biosynthesis enzymes-like protein [Glarea lozoyensis ATCC 20868]EPE28017.1 Tetrahydrobiopterin biosynthesis enzymes-like protein [Glarea lozoyensis ATCC 20868]
MSSEPKTASRPSPALTHEIQSRIAASPASIHVRNLQTTLPIGTDAWGRPNKNQPVLISCSVHLRDPFNTASEQDAVTESTVHYGTLSKTLLEACELFKPDLAGEKRLRAIVSVLQNYLFGNEDPFIRGISGMTESLLTPEIMNVLTTKVHLPKASLLGSGVSLTLSTTYTSTCLLENISSTLRIHDLRIPTLIGVNSNERLAKQMVVANVELDRWFSVNDAYVELEKIVTAILEASSFQTLESLASHLCHLIIEKFVVANPEYPSLTKIWGYPVVKVGLEKPTAVTMADAPCVELVVDTDPTKNSITKGLWDASRK